MKYIFDKYLFWCTKVTIVDIGIRRPVPAITNNSK